MLYVYQPAVQTEFWCDKVLSASPDLRLLALHGGAEKSGFVDTKTEKEASAPVLVSWQNKVVRRAKPCTSKKAKCHSLLIPTLKHNVLGHAPDNLCIKLDGVVSGEANVLGQIVWENVDEIPVPVFIKQGFVSKLGIFIR